MFDYGLALGTVRQIHNDIHNFSSPEALSDLASGVYTLPVIYALSNVDHPAHGPLRACLSTGSEWTNADRDSVWRILTDMNVLTQCAALAEVYADQACQALSAFPHQRVKLLELLVSGETD